MLSWPGHILCLYIYLPEAPLHGRLQRNGRPRLGIFSRDPIKVLARAKSRGPHRSALDCLVYTQPK